MPPEGFAVAVPEWDEDGLGKIDVQAGAGNEVGKMRLQVGAEVVMSAATRAKSSA